MSSQLLEEVQVRLDAVQLANMLLSQPRITKTHRIVRKPVFRVLIRPDNDKRLQVLDLETREVFLFEPRCEKTGLRGFRPGPTQTGLYCHRRWLET